MHQPCGSCAYISRRKHAARFAPDCGLYQNSSLAENLSPAARENFTATKKIATEVHGAQFAVEMGGMEEKNQRGGLLLTPGMGAAQENGNANGPWRARFARSLRQIVYSFIAQHGDLKKKRVDARLCGRSGIRMTHDLHDTNARRT